MDNVFVPTTSIEEDQTTFQDLIKSYEPSGYISNKEKRKRRRRGKEQRDARKVNRQQK